MSLEDLDINIGVREGGDELEPLIGQLYTLDSLDDIDIDVNVNVDKDSLPSFTDGGTINIGQPEGTVDTSSIGRLDMDEMEINAPDVLDDLKDLSIGGLGDGEALSDGGGEVESLTTDQLQNIETELDSIFDPRGMINKDLTIEDIIGDSDEELFDITTAGADRLIDEGRGDSGVERLFDFEALSEREDFEGFSELFDAQENDPDRFSELMDTALSTPRERIEDRGLLQSGLDRILNRNPLTGDLRDTGALGRISNIDMSDFYTALAQVVPLLLVFVGAIPAAITALGVLAGASMAAAGALTAIGGLAVMGGALALGDGDIQAGLTEMQEIISEDIIGALEPLSKSFDDIFFDALNGFETFMEAIASQGQVLTRIKDDARALGSFIIDFVPSALGMIVMITDAFMPLFDLFGEWVNANFGNIMLAFVNAAAEALPLVLRLVGSFIQFLPLLFDLSLGFLWVASSIMMFLGFIAQVFNSLGRFGRMLGVVIGVTFALASTFSLLISVIGFLSPMFTYFAGTLVGGYVTAAWQTMIANYGLATSLIAVTVAAGILVGILTFGVAPILGSLSSGFLGLSSDIDEATKSLNKFNGAGSGAGMSGFGGFGGSPTGGLPRGGMVYNDNTQNTVEMPPDASQNDARRMNRKMNYQNSVLSSY